MMITPLPDPPATTPANTTAVSGLTIADAADGPRRLNRRTLLAGILLGIVFTLGCVQWSLIHGRLSQDPTFDDSFYLWDGAHLLNIFFQSGSGAFFHELVQNPPHSPFSTLGATLAFAVFGIRDWAPYVLINGGVLLALLACVSYLARAFSLRWRLLSMGLVLTLPLAVVAVHDYRPDFACALLTAAGIYLMVESAGISAAGPPRARVWRWTAAGLGFGLALLVKPTFFLHTLFMEALALGAFVALHAGKTRPFSPRDLLREGGRALGWLVLPSLLLAAPYYVVNAHETYQYFVDRSVGQHGSIWRIPGGAFGLIRYYTFGLTGTTMFGGAFYVGLVLYVAAVLRLGWRRRWHELATHAALLLIGAASVAVMVVGKLPNPFFSLTCFLLLVFVAWRAIFTVLADFLPPAGAALRGEGTATRTAGIVAAGVLLLAGVVNVGLLRLAPIWDRDSPGVRALVARNHSFPARILADMTQEMGVGIARIKTPMPNLVTTGGFINSTTLRWLAQRDGLPFEFFDHELSSTPEDFRLGLLDAYFVIVPQDHTAGVFQELPSWTIHEQVTRLVAAAVTAGRLRLLHSYLTVDGGEYQLFVNDDKISEWVDAFSPTLAWDSFLPWEGPYPKVHLGKLRWAVGQHQHVTIAPEPAGRALLRFSVRADQPVHGTVAVDGTVVTAIQLPGATGFHEFRVPINLTGNAVEVTFDFDKPPLPSPDGIQRALLFRQLEVQPTP